MNKDELLLTILSGMRPSINGLVAEMKRIVRKIDEDKYKEVVAKLDKVEILITQSINDAVNIYYNKDNKG